MRVLIIPYDESMAEKENEISRERRFMLNLLRIVYHQPPSSLYLYNFVSLRFDFREKNRERKKEAESESNSIERKLRLF